MKNNLFSARTCLLLGCIIFQAIYTGILMNSSGIILSAIMSDCGFSAGSMSLYYTIRTLCCALFVSTMSKVFTKYRTNLCAVGMAFVMSISFLLMTFFTKPYHWYFSAALFGIGMTCTLTLIPIIINNCFSRHSGLLLGITMASSGLASAAFSPICSTLIQSFGWRPAVFYMGIVSFLAALPFAAGMIYTPAAAGTSPVSSNDDKTPLKHSRNHCLLALCAFSLSAGAVLVQFANYIPVYAASIGFSATAGAVMTSCVMVGNILGKFFAGLLNDRLGTWNTLCLYFGLIIISLVSFLSAPHNVFLLYMASCLFGIVFGISVVMPSLTAKKAFGFQSYIPYLSHLVSICNAIGAVSTIAIGNLYDSAGSFSIIFISGIILCLFSMCSALIAGLFTKHGLGFHKF